MVIIDMQKPERCEKCAFLAYGIKAGVVYCMVSGRKRYIEGGVIKPHKPPSWCPIKEVQV